MTLRRLTPLLFSLLVLAALLSLLPPLDYSYFSTAARAWLSGSSRLYDAGAPQFFYAPWSLLILAPLAPLPEALGRGIFGALSLTGMVLGVVGLGGWRLSRAGTLALTAPPTAAVVLLAQWDGLLLGGIGLAWLGLERRRPWLLGLGALLITTKPTHMLVVVALLLYAVRGWRPGELARAAAPLLAALGASLLACGFDWPLRYLAFVRSEPPAGFNVALETLTALPTALFAVPLLAAVLGLSWGRPVSPVHLALGLVSGLLAAPFVVPYHYVLAAPALAQSLERHPRLGLVLWGLSAVGLLVFLMRWPALLLLPAYLTALWLVLALWLREGRQASGAATPGPDTSSSPTRSG